MKNEVAGMSLNKVPAISSPSFVKNNVAGVSLNEVPVVFLLQISEEQCC